MIALRVAGLSIRPPPHHQGWLDFPRCLLTQRQQQNDHSPGFSALRLSETSPLQSRNRTAQGIGIKECAIRRVINRERWASANPCVPELGDALTVGGGGGRGVTPDVN